MLAKLLFAVLAASTGLADETPGCEGYVTLGTGQPGTPTIYVTNALAMYEESNGVLGLQRGCPGDAPDVGPDQLLV